MLWLNLEQITVGHFPDNTQALKMPSINFDDLTARKHFHANQYSIRWKYESDEECMTLYYITKHLRNTNKRARISLVMEYLPNARMDRVKNPDEVFTLKYFAEFINSLEFDIVYLLDIHSDVGRALINNVSESTACVADYVRASVTSIKDMGHDTPVLYFPDAGAKKRYEYLVPEFGKNGVLYGEKQREWRTGKILGLEIKQESPVVGDTVIMIDDIIAYGGTMKYSAEKLKERGFKNIFIYCTHLENSVLNEEKGTLLPLLNDGTVKNLFTTDSLFSGEHKAIIQLK